MGLLYIFIQLFVTLLEQEREGIFLCSIPHACYLGLVPQPFLQTGQNDEVSPVCIDSYEKGGSLLVDAYREHFLK